MQPTINVNAVTAVRLGDGWRTGVKDFTVLANLYGNTVPIAGAVWQENGCECSAPLTAILATNKGTPAVDVLAKVRPNPKVQQAIRWLEGALQGGPQAATYIIKRAKEEQNIKPDTLHSARTALGINPHQVAHQWLWELPGSQESPVVESPDAQLEEAGADQPKRTFRLQ